MSVSPYSAPGVPTSPSQSRTGRAEQQNPHLARQPILDREQKVFGYELLFRSGPESVFLPQHAHNSRAAVPAPVIDLDGATRHTIDLSILFGSAPLAGSRLAFVNCTRNLLLADVITLLPREHIVVELLEDMPADQETLAACDRLHRAGYTIALDDYVPTADTLRLLHFADIVKVDILATDCAAQAAIAAQMHRRGIRLVAEKVETREQFQLAQRLGYHYFQGYFFQRPENLDLRDIPCSKLAYIRVLSLAQQESFDVDKLEEAILREPSLCFRLLRFLNSAAFGVFPVRSIRHALALLGQREIRRWVSIVVAISLASDGMQELLHSALVRARCCEILGSLCREDRGEAFLAGILSLMDAILNRPLEAVISELPLTAECQRALNGGPNGLGMLLRMAICCEHGDWDELCSLADQGCLTESTILDTHNNARAWADQILAENRGIA